MTIRTTIKADYYKHPRKTFGLFRLIDLFKYHILGIKRVNYPIVFGIKHLYSLGYYIGLLLVDPINNYIDYWWGWQKQMRKNGFAIFNGKAIIPERNEMIDLRSWHNKGVIALGVNKHCNMPGDPYFDSKTHSYCRKRNEFKYGSRREIYEAIGIVQQMIEEYPDELYGIHVHDH